MVVILRFNGLIFQCHHRLSAPVRGSSRSLKMALCQELRIVDNQNHHFQFADKITQGLYYVQQNNVPLCIK